MYQVVLLCKEKSLAEKVQSESWIVNIKIPMTVWKETFQLLLFMTRAAPRSANYDASFCSPQPKPWQLSAPAQSIFLHFIFEN